MCGIAGKISFNGKPIESQDIKKMTDILAHRGPDDEGVYLSPNQNIGLGHRRLSILDLSSKGHQPMSYLDRYEIVHNGEIYNYREERKKLIDGGYKFNSDTDTEVILALYDKYGTDSLKHLRGMFAFAIYDKKKQELFCVRDRVGQKPFKYYLDDKTFIFASELKAILTQKEYSKEPDYTAIHHYLTLQYCPAPLTGFKGIKKLEPGHYLKVNISTGEVINKQYWHLDYSKKLKLTEREWQTAILEKLTEATRLRMISDVPLGAFLSGGVDSSAIVGLMSKLSDKPVKTFSIGFNQNDYNELPFAKKVADQYKTDHTEFVVKPDASSIFRDLVRQYEEPYADSSAIPTYYLSKLTRDHVTVALNGDGGDENFAGYGRYSVQQFASYFEKLKYLNTIAINPITKLTANIFPSTFFHRANRFSSTLSGNYAHRYTNYVCYFNNEEKENLYTNDFKKKVWSNNTYDIIANKFTEAKTPNKLDQTLYTDINSYLPDDLLVKVDIDTMSVGLEGRSPFLDHEFMELAAQIPSSLKIKGFNNKKYILKETLRDNKVLQDEIIDRPKKGFGVPIEHWFRSELKDFAYDNLLSSKAINRNLFTKQGVKNILDAHNQTRINYANHIWTLLTLELWFQEYFD